MCIIDGIVVATGSLNWTRQAVVGNYENVVIIKHAETVKSYETEYARMWSKIEINMKKPKYKEYEGGTLGQSLKKLWFLIIIF